VDLIDALLQAGANRNAKDSAGNAPRDLTLHFHDPAITACFDASKQ